MDKNNMKQKSGNNSENYQIAGNVTIGPSYGEIKEIVTDLFKQNFYNLSTSAKNIAENRVNELMDGYLKKISKENITNLNIISDPSFQCSIYEAQKEYAKSGDINLKEELINILLEKMKSNNPKKKDILLNEVINILPKLTRQDKDFFTLLFVFEYAFFPILTLDKLNEYINNSLIFFDQEINSKSFTNNLEYLEYNNCILNMIDNNKWKPIDEIIAIRYQGLFSIGFSKKKFEEIINEKIENYNFLIIPCFRNTSLFQLNALNEETLKNILIKNNKSNAEQSFFKLFSETTLPKKEIQNLLSSINIKMKTFMNIWNEKKNLLKLYRLTPLGKTIAILNYNNKMDTKIKIENFI